MSAAGVFVGPNTPTDRGAGVAQVLLYADHKPFVLWGPTVNAEVDDVERKAGIRHMTLGGQSDDGRCARLLSSGNETAELQLAHALFALFRMISGQKDVYYDRRDDPPV